RRRGDPEQRRLEGREQSERQPGGPGRRRRACRRAPPGAQRRAYGRAAQRGCGQKDWRGRRSRGGAGGGGEEEKKEEGGRSRDELRQARTLRDGAAVKTGGAKSSNRAELRDGGTNENCSATLPEFTRTQALQACKKPPRKPGQ
ncbi:unnamed protein product, partial [Prorocentrum cordatum]